MHNEIKLRASVANRGYHGMSKNVHIEKSYERQDEIDI